MSDTQPEALDPRDINVDPTGILRFMKILSGVHHKTSAAEHAMMTDRGYLPDWSPCRVRLATMIRSDTSDKIVSVIVLFNLVIVVLETDINAIGEDSEETINKPWVSISNTLLLAFYSFEVGLRIFTLRKWFFTSRLNMFDFFNVSLDLAMTLLEWTFGRMLSMTFLRLFRLTRLRRSVNVMLLNPELSLLIRGMKGTGKTLFWGTLLILVTLVMWSLVAVHFIHPINREVFALGKYDGCERCAHAFSSVMQSSLTFYQQLVVGDAWSEVTIPIIEHSPSTAFFFIVVHVSVSIGLMNLLLAVIVERADAARNEDYKELAREEIKSKEQLRKRLASMFSDMDQDEDGLLSLDEVKQGYSTNPEFSEIMIAMDVEEGDLDTIYCILEGAGTEGVKFNDFVDQLFKFKSEDQHTMLIFIRFYITEVRNKLTEEVQFLQEHFSNHASSIQNTISEHLASGQTQQGKQTQAEDVVDVDDLSSTMTVPTSVIDGVDVQEIISTLKECIYQELRPLQCFAEEISALLKRSAFLELPPQIPRNKQDIHCNHVRLADLMQQNAGQIQPSDTVVAAECEGDIDSLAVSAGRMSQRSFAGAVPVPLA